MEKEEINTIHDDDLDDFLKKIGVFNDYQNNKLKCCFCGNILRDNNFYAILPKGKEITFCCNQKGCIEKINTF